MEHKLNRNIINIIHSYNLPLKNNLIDILNQLKQKTVSIKAQLDNNYCYNDKFNLFMDIKNTKIKLIKSYCDYWIIRKI